MVLSNFLKPKGRYEMNKQNSSKNKKYFLRSTKECAHLAVFVATVIGAQLALSALPSVELVSVLFISYAFVMGAARGAVAATAFTLLRQLVFGFYPTVFILYLVYYNLLAVGFGLLGKRLKIMKKDLLIVLLFACVCTPLFSLLDCVITPLWYAYTAKAAKAYFFATLPVCATHIVCVGVSVFLLFLPLSKTFAWAKRKLR